MNQPRTASGVIWSAVERFSSLGIQFVLNIIIARILAPSDFGVIGMLTVFLAICQCLIDSGFSSALIQSKERKPNDYGTVFLFNILISVSLYFVLFFCAPLIARFYDLPILKSVLRVIGLNIVITAFSNVQKAVFTININFKTQSIVSIVAALLSGGVGIYMAYHGFGVWALVFQTLVNGTLTSTLYWILSKYRFKIIFDKDSFHRLWAFGIKLMFAGLLNTIYENLYALFIGKKFSSQDLGYYSRADQFGLISAQTLSSIIGRVAFPVLSKQQEDKVLLRDTYTRFIKSATFLIFPIMVLIAACSKQIVVVLLTEKWLPIVPMMIVLAIEGMCSPLNRINLALLQSVGRSDLFLRLEIVKKVLATCILLFTIRFGVFWVCIGRLGYSIIATLFNMYFTVSIINKNYWQQIIDWLPNFIISAIVGTGAFVMANMIDNVYISLMVTLIVGMSIYLLLSSMFNRILFQSMWSLSKEYVKKIKHRSV